MFYPFCLKMFFSGRIYPPPLSRRGRIPRSRRLFTWQSDSTRNIQHLANKRQRSKKKRSGKRKKERKHY